MKLSMPHRRHLLTFRLSWARMARSSASAWRDLGAGVRKMGYLPEAMVNYLSLLGWAPPGEGQEILSSQETIRLFSLDRVNGTRLSSIPTNSIGWSRNHVKSTDIEKLARLAAPYLQQAGWLPDDLSTPVQDWLQQVVLAVRNYLDRLEQITAHAALIFNMLRNRFPGRTWRNCVNRSPAEYCSISGFVRNRPYSKRGRL